MHIWRGYGILVAPIAVISVIASVICSAAFADWPDSIENLLLPGGVGLIVAGIGCWYLGAWLRKRIPVEAKSGERGTLQPGASFVFIPMRAWGPLLGVMGFFLVAGKFIERPSASSEPVAAPVWEARIPSGAETDPIALNIAFGVESIPNRDIVERWKRDYIIQPHSFPDLVPKASNAVIFKVVVHAPLPPDMGGIGPFYLVKADTNLFALTKHNFARLFSPIEQKSDVLPFLTVYERLFGSPFAMIVSEETRAQASETDRKPPKVTRVSKLRDGYRVALVTYTRYHVEAYLEKTVRVGRDGIVQEEKPEHLLQEIGPGIVF
jgi:hypothetical protein